MNENLNSNVPQGGDLDAAKRLFDNYEKQKTEKSNKGLSKEEKLARYFVPRNTNAREIFRVLPVKAGEDYFKTAFFHVIKINVGNGKKIFKKIYCPTHNDLPVPKLDGNGEVIKDMKGNPVMVAQPCLLCEKSKTILLTQDPSLKRIKKENMSEEQLIIKEENDKIYKDAMSWAAKKFYILKGIDRGTIKDGVKFWRFKHNYKNQGVQDKLIPVLGDFVKENKCDFASPEKGSDIKITVIDSTLPNGKIYKDISAISTSAPCKLHDDKIIVDSWLADTTTWRDVFKRPTAPNITPDQYMEFVVNGIEPYWDDSDSNNKRWVFPGNPELEKKANTRDQNLDADNKATKIEYASDIVNQSYNTNIGNVTSDDVGNFKDNAINLGGGQGIQVGNIEQKETVEEKPQTTEIQTEETSNSSIPDNDFDDLPF